MLKRIHVDNYKCLVNFEATFGDLALLLGPNGVGKSAVFDVMYALRQLLTGKAKITDPEAFPTRTLTRWQKRLIQVFEIEVQMSGGDLLTYRLEVQHERETRKARVWLERLTTTQGTLFEFSQGEVHLFRDDGSPGPSFTGDWSESFLAHVVQGKDNKRLTNFLDYMRKMVVCGTYPRSLVTESTTEDPVLARDGSNFAAWYRHVQQERPDLVSECTKALAQVIDGFKGIRLEKVGEEARAFIVSFDEGGEDYLLKLDELSDGQRALMVLYAVVHLTAGQGHTLFLDEPDNYLALPEIQPWLITLSDACGDTIPQAILTSHHPELIDYLGSERGILLGRENSGPVTARPLAGRPAEGGLKLSEIIARGWER